MKSSEQNQTELGEAAQALTRHEAGLPAMNFGQEALPYIAKTDGTHQGMEKDIKGKVSGITSKIYANILQSFFTTRKGSDVSGFGLSITPAIVEAPGDSLRFRRANSGSILTVILYGIP